MKSEVVLDDWCDLQYFTLFVTDPIVMAGLSYRTGSCFRLGAKRMDHSSLSYSDGPCYSFPRACGHRRRRRT